MSKTDNDIGCNDVEDVTTTAVKSNVPMHPSMHVSWAKTRGQQNIVSRIPMELMRDGVAPYHVLKKKTEPPETAVCASLDIFFLPILIFKANNIGSRSQEKRKDDEK